MYQVRLLPPAIRDLERLDKLTGSRIVQRVKWLAEHIDSITPKRLAGQLSGLCKLREGDYRIIYQFLRGEDDHRSQYWPPQRHLQEEVKRGNRSAPLVRLSCAFIARCVNEPQSWRRSVSSGVVVTAGSRDNLPVFSPQSELRRPAKTECKAPGSHKERRQRRLVFENQTLQDHNPRKAQQANIDPCERVIQNGPRKIAAREGQKAPACARGRAGQARAVRPQRRRKVAAQKPRGIPCHVHDERGNCQSLHAGSHPSLHPHARALPRLLFAAVDDERNPAERKADQEQDDENHPAPNRDLFRNRRHTLVIAERTLDSHAVAPFNFRCAIDPSSQFPPPQA